MNSARRGMYPPAVRAIELEAIIGGNCFHELDPQACLVLKQAVNIEHVRAGDGRNIEPMSAADWEDEYNQDYHALQSAMAAGDDTPPVVLARFVDGSLRWLDGWHRISLTLHLGRTHLDAYIYQLGENPGAWD